MHEKPTNIDSLFGVPIANQKELLQEDKNGSILIHSLAKNRLISRVPKNFLNQELLLTRDNSGLNVFEILASVGGLKDIEPSLLTLENLTSPESHESKNTALHNAAEFGFLAQVPPDILNEQSIRLKDQSGSTVIHLACITGQVKLIPRQLLKEKDFCTKNKDGWTPLHCAAEYGHLDKVPKEFLTRGALKIKTQTGKTPLHKIADQKKIRQVPPSALCTELLLIKDNEGRTPLHQIGAAGTIQFVNKNLLRKEYLLVKDNENTTVLHEIARSGDLNKIDPKMLSLDLLKITNKIGRNILHEAARSGKPKTIPNKFLKSEYLLEKTLFNHNTLDFFLDSNCLEKALGLVDLKELIKISKAILPPTGEPTSSIHVELIKEIAKKKRVAIVQKLEGGENCLSIDG